MTNKTYHTNMTVVISRAALAIATDAGYIAYDTGMEREWSGEWSGKERLPVKLSYS